MKILITGAAGFIGRDLTQSLSTRHEVIALARRAEQAGLGRGLSLIAMDLTGPLNIPALPTQVDVIIHLAQANVTFPEAANELFAVNTGVTQQLLDYGRRTGAQQFILASTGDVYGSRLGLCRESDMAAPVSYYGATKYASELLVNAYASYLKPCVLRLFQPYGPGQVNRLIPRLADRIRQAQTIRLNQGNRPHVTPIYIDDVVSTFEMAIDLSYAGRLNVAGNTVVSLRSLVEALGQVLGVEPSFEETDVETGDMMGDNSRLKEALGISPCVGLNEGLSRTFANEEATKCQTPN